MSYPAFTKIPEIPIIDNEMIKNRIISSSSAKFSGVPVVFNVVRIYAPVIKAEIIDPNRIKSYFIYCVTS